MHNNNNSHFNYKDLEVWKQSRLLAIRVIEIASKERQGRGDWALYDQIRRAALSVPSNIAEGDERGTNKDALRFLYISKGSLAEFRTQIDIAYAANKLTREEYEELETKAFSIAKLLGGLVKSRQNRERKT